MRILVLSDSHGLYRRLTTVIDREREKENGFQAMIFLGDGEDDYDIAVRNLLGVDTYRVRGNNDWDSSIAFSAAVDIGSHRYFLCHGHRLGVGHSLEQLENAARQNNCQAALFGHTHRRHYSFSGGIHLFNPGSISLPRDDLGYSYGIITEENGKLDFYHCNL